MKRALAHVRFGVAIALWIVMLVVIWAHGMAKRGWMSLRRTEASERRRINATHNAVWAGRVLAMVRAVLDLEVRTTRSARPLGLTAWIVVSNHESALDATVVPPVAVDLENPDIRWVVNAPILFKPLIGSLFADAGYAGVWRPKDDPNGDDAQRRERNAEAMRDFRERVRSDGASVGLFPEGERVAGRDRAEKLAGLRTFRELCRDLPDHGVAVVTVLWPPGVPVKTVFDAVGLCGRVVEVRVRLFNHVPEEEAEAFLNAQFETIRMEKEAYKREASCLSLTA